MLDEKMSALCSKYKRCFLTCLVLNAYARPAESPCKMCLLL